MGKYDALWEYVRQSGATRMTLTFAQISEIAGTPLDHSFLTAKKALVPYGYAVGEISMKEQTVLFVRAESDQSTMR